MMNGVSLNVNYQNYQPAFRAKKGERKALHEFLDSDVFKQARMEELKRIDPEYYKEVLRRESINKAVEMTKIQQAKDFIKKLLKK